MAETTKKTTTEEKALKLNKSVWEIPFVADLVAQVLYVYMNNERKGTSNAKTRGDVSGGGKKPWKQKGTGRARSGSIRSPLWVGGGVTFVPNDKNWKRKINKQMAKKATCMMLSERLRSKELDFVNVPEKDVRKAIMNKIEQKTVIVSSKDTAVKELKNVVDVNVVSPEKLNAKHLAGARNILIDQDAVKILEERLTNGK